jgi:hypothetical protein
MISSVVLALTLVNAQVVPDPQQPRIERGGLVRVPINRVPINPPVPAATVAPQDDEATLASVDLPTDPASLVIFLRRQKVSDADQKRIGDLVRKLGDDDFDQRQGASEELIRLGPMAVSALKGALQSKDLEVHHRAESCLKAIESVAGPAYQEAVIRLLAKKAPDKAVSVLLDVVPDLRGDAIIDTVAQSLARAGVPSGQPAPALVQALADKVTVRREVAGEAIARAGDADARKTVRALLIDPEPLVRIRVATALLDRGEAEALPALIKLLREAPGDRAYEVENALLAVAREQSPEANVGKTPESRKAAAEAWQGWYDRIGKKLDLPKVMEEASKPGSLVMLTLSQQTPIKTKAIEVDATGKAGWEFEVNGTAFAMQKLPRDRILVAEYTNRKVTERTTKGDIVWSKDLPNLPIEAIRLQNGNTVIGLRNQILEVDKDGNEVRTHTRNGDILYAMTALRNGEIAAITSTGRFVRMDAECKEISSFPTTGRMYSIGGHFAVSPNGSRITIPMYNSAVAVGGGVVNQGRVIEYDNTGKVIWEAEADRPTSVRRLPNGNVLVASRFHSTVLELDNRGKQVNKYEAPGVIRGVLDTLR